MATLFGKETFEGGSLPAGFDSEVNSYGTSTLAADATSKVTGTYSLVCSATAESGHWLAKDLGASYSELFVQFKVFLPSGWVFPTGGFLTFATLSTTAASFNVEFKVEDYGAVRLIIQGIDLTYQETGINIPLNTITKLEIRIVKSATVGVVSVWLNNDVEGSPNFTATGLNTGAGTLQHFEIGFPYVPATTTSMYYDEITVATTFIGAGETPSKPSFRKNNLRPRVFSPGIAR